MQYRQKLDRKIFIPCGYTIEKTFMLLRNIIVAAVPGISRAEKKIFETASHIPQTFNPTFFDFIFFKRDNLEEILEYSSEIFSEKSITMSVIKRIGIVITFNKMSGLLRFVFS